MSKLTAEERAKISEAMSLLGSRTSPRKAAAGKKNLAKALKIRWENYRKRLSSKTR